MRTRPLSAAEALGRGVRLPVGASVGIREGDIDVVGAAWSVGRRWTVAAVVAVLVTACSSPSEPEPPAEPGIPASWVQRTTEGWPGSDGHGSSIPVLTRGSCLLAETPPQVLGRTAEVVDVGWGPYGDDSGTGDTAFRYVCDFLAADAYAGELQLIKAGTPAQAQRTVEEFTNQTSTTQQDNTVQTVRSGGLDVHVLSRWYPTNPQGMYQAMVFDPKVVAVAVLEINSLDETRYRQTSPQQVADALVASFA